MNLMFSNDWLRKRLESDPDDEPTAGAVYGHCSRCGSPLDDCGHCIWLEDPRQPMFPHAVRVHLPIGDKMTTTVHIVVPKPNHKRVRVTVVNPETGEQYPSKPPVIVEHGANLTEYVHSGQRLIVDEID
jgi:hypothetical protein